MGYRLHPLKKYVVEYGDAYFSGDMSYNINSLILRNCEDAYLNDSEDELEINKQDFKNFIDRFSNKEERKKILEESNITWDEDTDFDDIASAFKKIYEQSDKSNPYIYMHWF